MWLTNAQVSHTSAVRGQLTQPSAAQGVQRVAFSGPLTAYLHSVHVVALMQLMQLTGQLQEEEGSAEERLALQHVR